MNDPIGKMKPREIAIIAIASALVFFIILKWPHTTEMKSYYWYKAVSTSTYWITLPVIFALAIYVALSAFTTKIVLHRYLSIKHAAFILVVLASAFFGIEKGREYLFIDWHKDKIKARIKDPDSLRLSNIEIVQLKNHQILCGKYNARNSYGGYGNTSDFISSPTALFLEGDMNFFTWQEFWKRACIDKTIDTAKID
jgi:hypothetical protein